MTSIRHTTPAAEGFSEAHRGVIFLLIAHLIWGAMAWYIKLLDHVSPLEVAVHRALWALPIAAMILILIGGLREAREALVSPRMLAVMALCSALIMFNWGFYIWSIQAGRAAESALGYYINPLMNVVVGIVFLGERFTRSQGIAVVLVTLGVIVQTVAIGAFPWLGMSLAATFCLYGLIRKKVSLGAVAGFFVEVLLLLPFGLAYAVWGHLSLATVFLTGTADTFLLMGLGLFTATTLMLFAAGVRRLRYSTVGLLQYISPSLVFLTAVFLFHEPMSPLRLFSFALVWAGLVVFSIEALREERAKRALVASTSAAEAA
jgi:chloramphenicol-sensitive protein RarD